MAKNFLRSVTPKPIWQALQAAKHRYDTRPVRLMEKWGVNFQRKDDIYSPLPDWDALVKNEKRWNKPSALKGIDYDLDKMKAEADRLFALSSTSERSPSDNPLPHVLDLLEYGEGYHQLDAMILYGVLTTLKPKRYVEVGGGMSTFFANLARQRYKTEGPYTKITTFEPFPLPRLADN
jgi:hypothetical protein